MSALIKKLHMYAGLLNLSILLVFGISGLLATVEPRPEARRPPNSVSEMRDFAVPPNLSDFDAATAAFRFLNPAATEAPYKNDVRRDAANNLAFNLYSVNGVKVVTLLEKERRLRIESRRNSIWHFFDNMHATTPNSRTTDRLIRMWTWYTEFSIWSLIFMSITGVWLWLASRPGYFWARVSFLTGSGAFVLLYALTR
ncbi:MAG TPA: PepSY domain-containing protein [Bryobacteraceae bacterium]